jgi:hypothetical protein
MPDYRGRMEAQREQRRTESEEHRYRQNLAQARAVQGLNDHGQNWDIIDVETGESARTIKPWAEIEKRLSKADEDEASRICIYCGSVRPSVEELAEHEETCGV